MIVDGIQVEELTQESFKGTFNEVSIDIEKQSFHTEQINNEWRIVLKGPIKLNQNIKALYFATGFGDKGSHITEAITFAQEKIKQ